MKYLGGKARHAKEIVNVMLSLSKNKTTWGEPFVGAGNVITEVPKHMSIYGSDIDSDLIALLQYVQQGGELPNTVTHDCYKAVKANPEHFSKHFVAFVSIGCSFSGKKWGGFARGCTPKGRQRNYALESRNKLMSMDFKNIHFEHKTYSEVSIVIHLMLELQDIKPSLIVIPSGNGRRSALKSRMFTLVNTTRHLDGNVFGKKKQLVYQERLLQENAQQKNYLGLTNRRWRCESYYCF